MLPSISVRGGSVFATDPGHAASWQGEAMWMPRVSAAYKLGERTVLKGGWGLYYDTLNAGDVANGTVVAYQTGYGVTTVTGNSADLGRTFVYNVNEGRGDPFPARANGSRFDTPIGSSLGADTLLGTAFTNQNLNREHARQQRWRVSVQRELASNLGLEVAYNGSYSDRIDRTIRGDYLPEQYWNGSNERNTTANTFLTAQVPNPFRIQNFEFLRTSNPALYSRLAGNTFFTQQTTQRNRLLRSFPQMNAGNGLMFANVPIGIVKVHSLEVVLNRRFADGLTGVFSFTANSVRENRIVDEFDREPTLWQGSNGGRPYRITASTAYDLPFGAGRAFLNDGGVLAAIAGGWQLAGNYDFQPGALLDWNTNLFFYGNLDDIAIDNPTRDRWFNVDAGFEKDPAKTPAAFQKRQFPFRVDGVRGQALSFLNMSVTRSLRIGSARTVQLRVDAQNVLNRQHWQNANTNPTSTNFGKVTTVTQNYMRFITFAMRLNF
jgi:hypothetical protein